MNCDSALFVVSPDDYDSVSTILTFGTCDTRQCIEILIKDDMIGEVTESFSITLERMFDLDSKIILDPNRTEVEITNNDGN